MGRWVVPPGDVTDARFVAECVAGRVILQIPPGEPEEFTPEQAWDIRLAIGAAEGEARQQGKSL